MRKLQWLGAVVGCGLIVSACADEKGVLDDTPAKPASTTQSNDADAGPGGNATATPSSPGSAGGTAAASSSNSPAVSSAPVTPPPSDGVLLGAPCAGDEECGTGQLCLKEDPDVFLGTVAGGVCTADCSDDPRVCQGFGVGAGCLAGESRAYCVTRCTTGSLSVQCHGRADTVCLPLNANYTDGACLPMCQSDADCPGQVCQPSVLLANDVGDLWKEGGVCVDPDPAAPALKQDGEACTADVDCQGQWCLPITEGSPDGVCSSLCNFATEGLACHPEAGEPVLSACLESVFSLNPRVGELGLCYPACDTDEDCHSGLVCSPETAVMDAIGRAGLCALPAVEPPVTTTDAGADAG